VFFGCVAAGMVALGFAFAWHALRVMKPRRVKVLARFNWPLGVSIRVELDDGANDTGPVSVR